MFFKMLLNTAVSIIVLMACVAPIAVAQSLVTVSTFATARVIVKFKSNSELVAKRGEQPPSRSPILAKRIGIVMSDGPAISEDTQVVIARGMTSTELAHELARQSDVEYAIPDQRRHPTAAPNDPLYGGGVPGNGPAAGQWYLRAPDAVVRSSLDIERAWSVTTGNANVVVAVVDSGVRFDHPDLLKVADGGNLLAGYDMISDADIANDGDGRDSDASDPGDWLTADEIALTGGPFHQCALFPRDSSWHGTQVSGLIAALTDNGIGMASVGRTVHVLPIRVLGKCGGFDSDIIAGMRWAAGLPVPGVPLNPNRAHIINLSLSGDGACSAAYQEAVAQINAAKTVIVASAGNSTGHAVRAPASCNGVIAIAALRHAGTKVGFSDQGPEIALSAPGGNCVNVAPGTACLYPILSTSNAGTSTPGEAIYTDSFDTSLGTSFSAPLVSGTVALMLSVQPDLTPLQIRLVLQATARPFPTTGGDNGDGSLVPQCAAPRLDAAGRPIDQLQCYCTIDSCGAGMLDAGAAVLAAKSGASAARVQAQGSWWNAPAGSESGWGINFAHQGEIIFATWFTYDPTGRAWWLSMAASRVSSAPDVYSGPLIETRGPPFDSNPFDPALVTRSTVGSVSLTFDDVNRGTFSYVVNGVRQTKPITRHAFGPVPTCAHLAQPDFASASNYSDIWWAASGTESGWGVNFTHQGDVIFATWFTYDADGKPLWLSAGAVKAGPGVYSGQLLRTTGPSFAAAPFVPTLVQRSVVGSVTLSFANGNAGTFAYTVNGATQTKQIARLLFAPPAGTVCH